MATSEKLPIYSLRIKTNNNVGKELCRFCFKVIEGQNFDIIGEMTWKMLNVLLIEMDFSIDEKFAMCRDCQYCIEKCFNFKLTCLFSEDTVVEHMTEGSKLNLEKVYLMRNLRRTFPRGCKICRLCMNVFHIDKCLNTEEHILANDLLEQYIPELNLDAVINPVICRACFLVLQSYSHFVTTCLDVEEKINIYCEGIGIDKRQVQLYRVLEFMSNEALKCEIDEIAVPKNIEELNEKLSNIESNCTELSPMFETIKEEIVSKSEDNVEGNKILNDEAGLTNGDQVHCLGTEPFVINKYVNCTKKEIDLDTEKKQEVSLPSAIKEEIAYDESKLSTEHNFIEKTTEVYIKREEVVIKSGDDMSSNNEAGFTNGGQVHCSDTQPIILNEYIFIRDKTRSNLVTEIADENPLKLEDEDQSVTQNSMEKNVTEACIKNAEIEIKSGDADLRVDFEKVGRKTPNRDLLCCPSCPFSTKIQKVFARHMLIHERSANRRLYKCDDCSFITLSKIGFTCHRTRAHIFRREKCKFCPYRNKYPFRLARHELTHKDPSERPIFNCELCGFQCLTKYFFDKHSHSEDFEMQMAAPNYKWYRCTTCSYKTVNGTLLNKHIMRFHSPKAVVFRCAHCPFKTKLKHAMQMHILIPRDKANIMYKCNQCPYKVKRKSCFMAHMQDHIVLRNFQMADTSHTEK